MSEPLLHLGNVAVVRKGVCSAGGAERMYAQAIDLSADAGLKAVLPYDVAVDRAQIERAVQASRPIIPNRTERSAGIDQDEADFGSLAHHAQMHDTLTAMQILNV